MSDKLYFRLKKGKIEKATRHSGWFDLFSTHDAKVAPGVITKIPTGVVAEFSHGLRVQMCEKSGRGLSGWKLMAGCIDADYDKEWNVLLTFHMPEPRLFDWLEDKQKPYVEDIIKKGHFVIPAGTAIAQFKIEVIPDIHLMIDNGAVFVDTGAIRQGGFGSTDASKLGNHVPEHLKERHLAICAFVNECRTRNVECISMDAQLRTLCGNDIWRFALAGGPTFTGTLDALCKEVGNVLIVFVDVPPA